MRVPSDDDLERDKLMQKARDFEDNQLSGAVEHINAVKQESSATAFRNPDRNPYSYSCFQDRMAYLFDRFSGLFGFSQGKQSRL